MSLLALSLLPSLLLASSESIDPTSDLGLLGLEPGPDYPDYTDRDYEVGGDQGSSQRPERGAAHHVASLHIPYNNYHTPYHAPAPPPASPPTLYSNRPSHNCTVEDEVLTAEICTPTYTTSCGPVSVKGTKLGEREQCVQISRTVCVTGVENQEVEVCIVEYEPRVHQVEAVSTQVKFTKECDKQMVTVCQPQPAYSAGAYTTVQHCKEVGQETCYNVPRLEPRPVQVEITLPEPVQRCQRRQVVIPTIQCEDLSERSCVKLPNAEETTLDVTACVPVVDKPKCDKVELVLPKQICRELLYGYAEKPVQHHQYHPKHHPHPPQHQPQHGQHQPQQAPYLHHSSIKYVNKVPVPKKRETTTEGLDLHNQVA